jgi:hypothetical protein
MSLRWIIASFFVLFFASPSDALAYTRPSPAYRKTVPLQRTDPRVKYLNFRQPNCMRAGSRVCDTKVEADPFIHYVNTIREQEEARQKQIRPWL